VTNARDIYIVRHAFAGHADPTQWPDDADRPLTKDGINDFRSMARGLQRLVPAVDLVLSSRFARAWQTAELLHEVARWPEPRECVLLEVGQPPSALLEILHDEDARSVALVGHDPHLSMLTSLLCAGSEDAAQVKVKKGAAVLLQIEGEVRPGGAELRWLLQPKVLRALDNAR
jgi:phosphohistidine phosphatase